MRFRRFEAVPKVRGQALLVGGFDRGGLTCAFSVVRSVCPCDLAYRICKQGRTDRRTTDSRSMSEFLKDSHFAYTGLF